MNALDVAKAMGIDLSNFLRDYGPAGAIIIIVALSIIQVVPQIKINPWTWLGETFQRTVNGKVIEKLGKMEKQIEEVQETQRKDRAASDEKDAKTVRIRILRFGDEVRNHQRHTKEHFDDILQDITDYEYYCKKHPHFENDKAVMTIRHIHDVYQKCLKENDFL